ncbi:diguanylate cyclase (GGDEF)-like protein/PAS domain S-box-containing protein [Duganella sp. SG902]|uniref:sensor domain-containing protein n=1 Tax=Duganella sp. SG902 TaxID=2587016 RepID=UPI00182F3ADC|nr:EAL domain-containing protein [Duganella sp. SG902]NVM76547.1 diguanylate cyclase (GGDEF)-like protein/PAS domain S-box-containing protein [Duganella sp. SG902]
MDRLPQPAYSRAPERPRSQRAKGRRQGTAFDEMFGTSPYFAFAIDERGCLLAYNQHAASVLGPLTPRTPASALYATWVLPMLQNEALPAARVRGYWRGELELVGQDGASHPVTQTIEWRAHAEPPAFLCTAYPLDDYDVYESRLRFKYLFEAHPHPMWVYDLETLRFLVVNAAAVAQYGHTEAEFLQMTIRDIRPPDQLQRLADNLAAAPAKGAEQSGVWTHQRRDGSRMRVDVSSHSVTLSGRPARLVFAHDITEREQLKLALQLRSRALEASINAIAITRHAAEGELIEYANPAFVRLFDHSPASVLGRRLETLLDLQPHDEQYQALQAAMQSRNEQTLLLRPRHRDGTLLWTQLHVAPVQNTERAIGHHVCVLTDMTAIMEYQEQLEHQAHHDALTGLPNRVLLNDRLAQAVTFSQRFRHSLWLVYIDLDNFKFINDHLGHQLGDQLLCAIAQRLRACASDGDTVARLGGDEFVLLLPIANQRPVTSILQLVQEAVAAPVTLERQALAVTCSIGVSVFPADGADAEQLLKHADIAMYRAKEAGRNQVQFYEAAMHTRVAERAQIEAELRNALPREQLSLVYQPKVDLRSGAVTGMEALVRWQHPALGAVSPVRFIGVAEETGLIVAIGRWVLRTACAQAAAWQRAGLPPLRVAVNLSARQFRDHALLDEVRAALADSGLQPRYLELELTESLMMHNVEEAVAMVENLKRLGVALSIDDFGTGYSSLAYLKQFPVDYLKIDQSFTREMLTEPKVAAIVRSVMALGHSLGFKVIAEGVETEAQLAYLRQHACDEMQGYYFSRPLTPEAFAAFIAQPAPAAPASAGAK